MGRVVLLDRSEPLGLGPAQCGQPVLETSFPTAFQRLDIRDGDLGVSLPGNQAKLRAAGWVLQNERFLTWPAWIDSMRRSMKRMSLV